MIQLNRTRRFQSILLGPITEKTQNSTLKKDQENLTKFVFQKVLQKNLMQDLSIDSFYIELHKNTSNIPLVLSDNPVLIFPLDIPFVNFEWNKLIIEKIHDIELDLHYHINTQFFLPISPKLYLKLLQTSPQNTIVADDEKIS